MKTKISKAFLRIKLRLVKIFVIGLVTALAFNLASPQFLSNSTAYAVGDLNVNWGVPDGDPIFVINNFAPGDIASHTVNVVNNASSPRPVGVRGIKTSETGNISTVLEIVISEGATDLYGGTTGTKTLAQFFTDSAGPDGIPLSTLGPSTSTNYTFEVTFPDSAGNEFQNNSVVFDIKIGIAIHVPDECESINLLQTPIFGTQNRDVINGTDGNDLIIAFEGNDVINAKAGNDCVIAGDGNDIVHGQNGNDVILGEGANDRIDGDNGNDVIIGGDGNDIINGNNGNDRILGGGGNDNINGENGNDIIEGNDGNDSLRGGNDNDNLTGGNGTDSARGDNGVDTCIAETKVSCEF